MDLETKARIASGYGDDWHPWYFERIHGGCLVTGAVCPLKTKGKFKGHPNYRKADKSTKVTVFIPDYKPTPPTAESK